MNSGQGDGDGGLRQVEEWDDTTQDTKRIHHYSMMNTFILFIIYTKWEVEKLQGT